MSAVTTRQYRPVTLLETSQNDPASVRTIRELADGANNAKAYACAHKLRSIACVPKWSSVASSAAENIIHVFAPVYVPDGYTVALWQIGHERFAGTGGEKTTWRLYCNKWFYGGGPLILDTTRMSPGYRVATIETTSDTHAASAPASLALSTDADGLAWMILTAQNSTTSARSRLTTIDITPRL